MQKNVSGQKIGCQMVSATDGSAFTGSVTVYVTGDAGTQAAGSVGSGACTHEGNGYHTYAPAQAETNYDLIAFTFIGTGAVPATVQVFTGYPQTGDAYGRLGAPAGASVSADILQVKGYVDDIGVAGAGLTALGDTRLANLDAAVSSRSTYAGGDTSGTTTLLSRVVGTIASGTHNAQSGDSYARLGAPAGASVSADVAAVKAQTAAIETDTQDLQTQIGTDGAGLTAIGDTRLANLDATVSSRLATAGYTAPLDAAGIRTAVGMSTNNLDTQLAALPTDADVQTAAAAALTAYDPPTKAELDSGFAGLNDPTAAAVADAVWDEAIGGHTSAGSTSKALIDVLDDTSTSLPLAIASITPQSAADIRAEMDANSTKLAAIVADTNELQTNQGNWLTADVSGLATAAALATVDGIVDDILEDTGTTLPGTLATIAGYVDTEVAAIKSVTDKVDTALEADGATGYQFTALALENAPTGGSAPSAADIRAEIDSNSTQLAAIVADTNELQTNQGNWLTADVSGLAQTGADGDTLETLSDQIDLLSSAAGSGATAYSITVQDENNDPIDGVEAWITTDSAGSNVVAGTLTTDAMGLVIFMLDAGDYYVWRQASGYNFTNPVAITVS